MSAAGRHVDLGLAHRTRAAVFWNAGVVTLINICQFGVMLVLVRLLSPTVYGQYGLLMAVMGFLYVFSAQNIVDYALQAKLESDVHYQDIFTTSVGLNFALFIITNVLAMWLRTVPGYAEIQFPLHWLSVSFLLQPGRAVRIAMLKRSLDWKRIRILHGIGFVLSAAIAIPLAFLGAGIYALLVPTYVVPLPFLYDIFVRCGWRPSWSWDLGRLRPALKFGANRQMSGVIVAGRRLLESSVVVQVAGFASFGLYGRAIGLAELVCNRMLGHAIEALYPALTKLDPSSAKFRSISALVLRTGAWLVIPTATLMAHLASVLVMLIYGDKWLEVIPLVGWSMALAATGAIYFTVYKLLLAHGQQRHCLWTDILMIAGTAACLYLLLPSGLIQYIQGLLVIQFILVAAALYFLWLGRGIDLASVAQALIAPILGTICASWVFLDVIEGALGAPAGPVGIGARIGLFVAVYALVLRLCFPSSLREIVAHMPKHQSLEKCLLLR